MPQTLTIPVIGYEKRAPASQKQRWNLGKTSRAIVASLAGAVLPKEGQDKETIDHVVKHVDGFVPFMPTLMRIGFPIGLLLIQWGTLVTLFALKPFTLLGDRVSQRYLRRWAESPFALFRALAQGVRGLILSAYYAQPDVYRTLGYKPEEYIEQCKAQRALLMKEHGDEDLHTSSMRFEDIQTSGADQSREPIEG